MYPVTQSDRDLECHNNHIIKTYYLLQSKTLVTGSLDVMESIGKKTYEALAEGDHGLKKLRKDGKRQGNLSQVSLLS